jgi:hypothetical protein
MSFCTRLNCSSSFRDRQRDARAALIFRAVGKRISTNQDGEKPDDLPDSKQRRCGHEEADRPWGPGDRRRRHRDPPGWRPGLRLSKAAVNSKETRRDGMKTRGRHGTQKVVGSWDSELVLGGHIEPILEAILRDTWDAAPLALSNTDFTSLAVASNVVTLGSGNPSTLGLRSAT